MSSLQIFIFFSAYSEEKMLTPKVYLQILSMQSFFVYFRKPPKKLSIQSIRRPKWHFISSRCLSSAIPERQYQIFVNYHKPSIHCFISFEALITWPIYLDVILWRSFYWYQNDRVFTDGRLFHVLRRLMYMIKPWIL